MNRTGDSKVPLLGGYEWLRQHRTQHLSVKWVFIADLSAPLGGGPSAHSGSAPQFPLL